MGPLGNPVRFILINDQWVEFFAAHDVRIGLSIDGPEHVHDAMRKTRRGTGTHAGVMRAVNLLKARQVSFHTISVIHSRTIDAAKDFWEFFKANEIRDLAFNFEETEGLNATSSLDLVGSETALERFLSELFERYAGDPTVRVREFNGLLDAVFGRWKSGMTDETYRTQTSRPFGIISVDVNGNFATFSPELLGQMVDGEPFWFGNVHAQDFDSILSDSRFMRVYSAIEAGVARCQETCSYFSLCRGGCPSNKYFETGSFEVSETAWCRRSRQLLIDVVIRGLNRHLSGEDEGRDFLS
jgi:uncharacterized protein